MRRHTRFPPPVLVSWGLACGLGLGAASPAARAEEDEKESPARHLEAKSAAIVAVKFVLKVGTNEHTVNDVGTVIDPSGLVMLRSAGIKPSFGRQTVKSSVANLRVVFPGDEKEYDAIVGATDTKLGLAFVRVRDLGGKEIAAVGVADPADPKLGDELFSVTRLDQGFDYAPYFGAARIVGQVTKPRSLWILSGFAPLGHVLFAPDGRAAGIVIQQAGVTEGEDFSSGRRNFLLPMKAAMATLQQAAKASEAAMAEDAARAKEKEAEDAAKPEAPAAAAPEEPRAKTEPPTGPPTEPPTEPKAPPREPTDPAK